MKPTTTARGRAPTSKLVKCPVCHKEAAMGAGDTHDRCLACLGLDHQMSSCPDCALLGKQARVARARMFNCWRGLGTTKPPTTTVVRQWTRQGFYPEYLSTRAVGKLLWGEPPSPPPRSSSQETRESRQPEGERKRKAPSASKGRGPAKALFRQDPSWLSVDEGGGQSR